MKRYFITFGSNHLPRFMGNPMDVMLAIEGNDFIDARNKLVDDEQLGIGTKFAVQYEMSQADDMIAKFGMKLYTKEELLKLMWKVNK